MESNVFHASVQYEDWKGSVAADNADIVGFYSVLQTKGLMNPDEVLFGIKFYSGVKFLLIEAIVGINEKNLRKVNVEMTLEEFFNNFKRFSITLSHEGVLEGKTISYE